MIGFLFLLTLHQTLTTSSEHAETDWRGTMTPVRNIGSCAGAEGPAAILAALEWHIATITGQVKPLSVQYLVDCGVDGITGQEVNRCEGVSITDTIKQIMAEQYLPYEEDYEYEGNFRAGRCDEKGAREKKLPNGLASVWVNGYTRVASDFESIQEALEKGPTINKIYTGDDFVHPPVPSAIVTDNTCSQRSNPQLVPFAGWQSNSGDPYFIVGGNNGDHIGEKGYVRYADNVKNSMCMLSGPGPFQLSVSPRKKIEYMVGNGKVTFTEARGWCEDQGWELAQIPTSMHNVELYNMLTKKFGNKKSQDGTFNFFWIGLLNTEPANIPKENWTWVSGKSGVKAQYLKFDKKRKYRFGVMKKVNKGSEGQKGVWSTRPAKTRLRFACSRYIE